MKLCIDQIAEMPTTIADMLELSRSSEEMAANYAHCLLQAREIWELSDELLPVLQALADEARVFWLCCPLDQVKVVLLPDPVSAHSLTPVIISCPSRNSSHALHCGIYMWAE